MEKIQPLQEMFLGKLDICLQKTETSSVEEEDSLETGL
jgi:hypothetical protein